MDSKKHIELIGYLDECQARDLEYLVDRLQKLKDHVPTPQFGICYHLEGHHFTFNQIAAFWPKFSGDAAYPIPGGREIYQELPKWEGEQLKLRHELMDFVIYEINQFFNIIPDNF